MEAAANECGAAAAGFSFGASDIRTAAGTAVAGWQGQAESAFVDYSSQVGGVMAANSDALTEAAGALQSFAVELESAQQVTRQAAADCETYQGKMTTAATQAAQAGQTADTLQAQAAAAFHPQMQSELNRQAGIARDQAAAAGQAANAAKTEFEAAQRRGVDADQAYQRAAHAASQKIFSAADRIRPVPRLPGGAPVPISVSPGDISVANALLPAVVGSSAGAWSDPGSELRRLAGRPLTAAEVMAVYDQAKAEAGKRGSVLDALGGVVDTVTFGAVSFGDPYSARYHGGQLAAMIPFLDPESVLVDGERLGADAAQGSQAVSAGDRVYRIYGEDPQALVEGKTLPDGSSIREGARPMGRSWTRDDPATMADPRARLGLPDANRGRFLIEGRVRDPAGITIEPEGARPVPGQPGGGDEILVPDPSRQIEILRVFGVSPPL